MQKTAVFGWPARGGNRLLTKTLLVMKLTVFFLTVALMNVSAAALSQNVDLSVKNVPLKQVFTLLQEKTGFSFLYGAQTLKEAQTVTIQVKDRPLTEVLDEIMKAQRLTYVIRSKTIIVSPLSPTTIFFEGHLDIRDPGDQAAPIPIRLRILDQDYNPLSGASISVKGAKNSGVTDAQGNITINAEIGQTLTITYVGFNSISIRITSATTALVVSSQNKPVSNGTNAVLNTIRNGLLTGQTITINDDFFYIPLSKKTEQLDEAVVYNGYQKIKQKYLTGSVTSLKMDSLLQPGLNTVDKMLEGRVPGLMFMQNSGQAGAAPKLRIRGTSTYLGSREPLWVVDGIIRTNPIPIPAERINDPDFVNLLGNAISGLNPYDIDQIDILKDATAAALYGVRAANGVIVVTTKRGKPGPPTVNYNVTGTFTRRPRYTDRAIYMMDSRDRIDVSREMIEKHMKLRGGALEAYEKDIMDYYNGQTDFETFKQKVDRAESINTDWLGNTMQDVFATNHTLSVSGGTTSASYRASVGYRTEPGVINKEKSDLYTGMLNMQMNYRKFKVEFNIQLNKEKRNYTPSEVGLLNYAYGTSRAIPLRNEDGSLYYYSTVNSNTFLNSFQDIKSMNIVNEMDQSGETVESNEYNASVDLSYEIAKGIQFNTKLAYTGGNSVHDIWFSENTEWVTEQRRISYFQGEFQPIQDQIPFGGELRHQTVSKQNYLVNARLNFSRFLDQQRKHQLTVEAAADVTSNQVKSYDLTNRGYYPDRGLSFASIDLSKYTAYAYWLASNGKPHIGDIRQNALRPYLTSTYIFNERYVLTATTSQEFSNSFGSRSNEKFLPTWALSGRWNIHEDLLRNQPWVDQAALLVSFGTRGNMLPGQTPYTIFQKGSVNPYYNAPGSTITSLPNPDLAWEKTQDYNGSIQFSLLKGRVNGSFGYFYIKTTNAFLEKKVSAINGAPGNTYVVNGGTLENQGVELSLNFKVIDNLGAGNKKGFMWRFDPQLGQVFNKLINNNLNTRNVMVDAATLTFQDFLNGTIPLNGKPVNTFYSYRFKSLDPNFGFPVFYGAEIENKAALSAKYNKMTKEELFSLVMVESGRREPVLQGGINNSFVLGNWTLNVTFTYSIGSKIRLLQIASGNYGTFRPSSQQNLRKEFNNRWRYPGDEKFTNIPAIQGAPGVLDFDKFAWWFDPSNLVTTPFATDYYQMYDNSDLRVVKGDYVKLQYVSLSYRFAEALCKQLHIKGATALLSGTNLATFANKALRGQDPSQSGSAPNINLSIRPVYALNLNISF